MKILFCGGGTAGHIYPALAIKEEIKSRHPKSEFLFIGRSGGDENNAILSARERLELIDVEGITRSFSLKNIRAIYKSVRAIGVAKNIIKEFKPDIVLGTGGYVCFPVILAAKMLKIPTVLHESNATPGLVTRLLAPKCDLVLLGFDEAKHHISRANTETVGNPVREKFQRISKVEARQRLTVGPHDFLVLSFGGSLGAETLHTSVIDCIKREKSERQSIFHIHATGKRYYESIMNENPWLKLERKVRIVPYIEDMPTYLASADVAITRAGAITTAELIATATPSILVPSPNVTDNHQYKNAISMANLGVSRIVEESMLSGNRLYDEIVKLREAKSERESMVSRLNEIKESRAAISIANKIEELICGRV